MHYSDNLEIITKKFRLSWWSVILTKIYQYFVNHTNQSNDVIKLLKTKLFFFFYLTSNTPAAR